MSDLDKDAVGGILMIVGLVGLLVGLPAMEEIQQGRTERFCLAHGYSRADWRWFGPNYCITRTDQTDVVVPTSEVK